MADRYAVQAALRAAIRSPRCWSFAFFALALMPMAWYLYVAWILPAWAQPLANADPVPEPNFVIFLMLCAIGTASFASVACGFAFCSYLLLPRPRPRARLMEGVVMAAVFIGALSIPVYVAVWAALL